MDIAAEPVWGSMENRAWDAQVWVADNAAIRAALGWVPTCDVGEGLRRMVEWVRANGATLRGHAEDARGT